MIEIYGASWCSYCKKAKKLVEDRNLKHTYYDVEIDNTYDVLKERVGEQNFTIPQIWWNGRYVGGYTELASEIENTIGGFGDGKI